MTDSNLKLYVWEDFLSDYTPGLAVALAHDEAEAMGLLLQCVEGRDWLARNMGNEFKRKSPQVIDSPAAFFVMGGS